MREEMERRLRAVGSIRTAGAADSATVAVGVASVRATTVADVAMVAEAMAVSYIARVVGS